jgi:hypothetical protein
MSLLHSRCQSTEASLAARVYDLQAEIERLNDRFDRLLEKSTAREKELVDRVIALTNPGALHVLQRSSAPAAPMPAAVLTGRQSAKPSVLPGQQPLPPRKDVSPRLTPELAKFSPIGHPAPATTSES